MPMRSSWKMLSVSFVCISSCLHLASGTALPNQVDKASMFLSGIDCRSICFVSDDELMISSKMGEISIRELKTGMLKKKFGPWGHRIYHLNYFPADQEIVALWNTNLAISSKVLHFSLKNQETKFFK